MLTNVVTGDVETEEDQHVILSGMAWQDFEALLAIRGERSGVHEWRKTTLARLLELWAVESDVPLHGYGSWTLKKEMKEAGGEPDECYILTDPENDLPDLVIEVEWSRATGLPRQEIYRRLGVRELWTLKKDGTLMVRVLEHGDWVVRPASVVLPALDLSWLLSFLDAPNQADAVRALRDALRAKTPGQ